MLPSARASSSRPLAGALRERRCVRSDGATRQPMMIVRRQRPIVVANLSRPRRSPLAVAASASSSTSESPPSSSSSRNNNKKKKSSFVIRRATEEDWWHLSQVHCAAFFPGTPALFVPLLRLDRVLGIEAGVSNELKGRGRFACLVAVQQVGGCGEEEEEGEESAEEEGGEESEEEAEETAAASAAPSSQPPFPLSLLPRQLHGCFETLEGGAARAGVLGTVCVDAQGCQLPPRRLPLRARSAAVATFVSLVAPNAAADAAVAASSSPAPPPLPPPSNLRAPPGAVAYLSNLAVSPHARELGVGRALLRAAEREAWGWGCRSAALHVGRDNAAAAGLYLSAGFRAVGGALPLVDPKKSSSSSADKGERKQEQPRGTARQQLAGGPLTLMLKVAPREVVARRAREAAEAKGRSASPSSSSSSSSSV